MRTIEDLVEDTIRTILLTIPRREAIEVLRRVLATWERPN